MSLGYIQQFFNHPLVEVLDHVNVNLLSDLSRVNPSGAKVCPMADAIIGKAETGNRHKEV